MFVLALAWFGLTGCTGGGDPDLQVEIFPEALTIAPSSWADTQPQEAALAILNKSHTQLFLENIEFANDPNSDGGREFLQLDYNRGQTIPVRGAEHITVNVTGPVANWDQGDHRVVLTLTIGGYTGVNIDGSVDLDTKQTFEVKVPVNFSFVCDIDQDGFEDYTCGGQDCDDEQPSVNPSADNVCDGIDNDCDGFVDRDC